MRLVERRRKSSKTLLPVTSITWPQYERRSTADTTISKAVASSRSTARNSSGSCARGVNVVVRVDDVYIGQDNLLRPLRSRTVAS